jgi:hypothetical protein
MTAQEQIESKGIKLGDEVWVNYRGVVCTGKVFGFTPKRVLATHDGRWCGDVPQPYSPKNVTKK